MGWDISYHPISEKQINEWYFDVKKNKSLIEKLSIENNLEDFYKEKYIETLKIGFETKNNEIFDKTHGYYIAVVQGFFQKFFYTRGSALSFIENTIFDKYYKKWEDFIPKENLTDNIENLIIENYCSGVFIPSDKVVELLKDYSSDLEVKNVLDNLFSHERIKIFLKALNFAKDNNLGLLEATEVMEPNPMDLNSSYCYSNLFNCDLEGPMLYRKVALVQIAEMIPSNADYKVTNIEKKNKKKGFWKKLFGK